MIFHVTLLIMRPIKLSIKSLTLSLQTMMFFSKFIIIPNN